MATAVSCVGVRRLELPASTSRTWRASQLRYTPRYSVLAGIRTLDPLIKSQLLYQLSYQDIITFSLVFPATSSALIEGVLNMDFDVANSISNFSLFGAENETRTRDPDLGKVVLYQLSYFRTISLVLRVGLEPTRPCGQGILSPSCLPFHHQSVSSDFGALERKTRLELATPTLARSCSTN